MRYPAVPDNEKRLIRRIYIAVRSMERVAELTGRSTSKIHAIISEDARIRKRRQGRPSLLEAR